VVGEKTENLCERSPELEVCSGETARFFQFSFMIEPACTTGLKDQFPEEGWGADQEII
jgi:hypothetical protein